MKPSEVPDDRTPGTEPREHFEGHDGRECGEHRTCGHRAWCFDCSEWCYPTIPCRGCELPKLRAALTAREEPTMPEPADRPSLRDQIAQAMRDANGTPEALAAWQRHRDQIAQAMRDANGTPEALAAWQRHPQLVPVDVYADAVMPVVQTALAEVERQRDEARAAVADEQRRADERSTELLEERDEALDALADAEKRAEQAGRERDKARDAIADERRGRLAVEATVRRVRLVCMPPTAPDLRAEVLAALDAEQPKETP